MQATYMQVTNHMQTSYFGLYLLTMLYSAWPVFPCNLEKMVQVIKRVLRSHKKS